MLGKLRALLAPVLGTPAAESGRKYRRPRPFVPALEGLEGRLTPAAVLLVTTRADVVAADGQLSLREAITRANNHAGADTILVPAGVYKITLDGTETFVNSTGDFDVRDSVTLLGAGAGATIIDGQQKDGVFDVFGTAPSSIRATFQGLTIRNGLAALGGGIAVGNADLVVKDCVITGNRVTGNGGGIATAEPGSGNVTLIRSTVSRNVAGAAGGGLHVTGDLLDRGSVLKVSASTIRRNLAGTDGGGIFASTPTLTRSTVSGNVAAEGRGGGIFAFTTTTLTNCTVTGNSAAGDGGGIITTFATLRGSIVSGNTAGSTGVGGGGIRAPGTVTLTSSTVSGNRTPLFGGGILATSVVLTASTVSGNTAGQDGGGIWTDQETTLTDTTVSGNTAGRDGGGIKTSVANLTNSTVSGNSALGDGGGIHAASGALLHVTVADNSAARGGGVFRDPLATAPLTLKNTIIAQNLTDFTGTAPDVSGVFASQGHNLIGDPSGSTELADGINGDQVGTSTDPLDPKLGPLQKNGGRTMTHALLPRSRAIDTGDNTTDLARDQRGLRRRRDGDGNGRSIVDIGAFER